MITNTSEMDFVCVLSVNGSLVSYHVTQQSENDYLAELRTTGGNKRNDVPEQFKLTSNGKNWKSEPEHPEIAPSLIHCIEVNL